MAAGTENAAVHHVDAVFRPLDVLQEAEPVIKKHTRNAGFKVEAGGGPGEVIHMVHGKPRCRLTCVGDCTEGHISSFWRRKFPALQ